MARRIAKPPDKRHKSAASPAVMLVVPPAQPTADTPPLKAVAADMPAHPKTLNVQQLAEIFQAAAKKHSVALPDIMKAMNITMPSDVPQMVTPPPKRKTCMSEDGGITASASSSRHNGSSRFGDFWS